ncbi:beta-galactosidase [Thermococcus sp. AM4]|uniref:beta-galactosidase n=1 Tax=Thermococcus sp. (strain AM4) TaxID=246969 RepID=UPI000186FB35|nr:Beta-galactosidase [Thermococcus sp. AM4]
MGKVGFNDRVYLLDGRPFQVKGGTLQFFRVPRESWRERLERMRRHGLNTVDTYVAWNWHEPAEGTLDFTGETHPQRDLVGFLELAEEVGLKVIIRPGPYICGEWRNGGIPDWLIRKHPEILAKGPKGPLPGDIYYPPITYLHPTYLEAVSKWYEAVLPIIKDYLHTNGGPIISVSIDDEPSYWETIFQPFLTDYNEIITRPGGLWEEWLRSNHTIEELGERYRGEFSDYSEIRPPESFEEPLTKILDWHRFKLWMINEYVKYLYGIMERYIDVPVSILDPYLLQLAWRHFFRYIKEKNLRIHVWTEFWYSFYRSFDFKEDRLGHLYFKTGVYRYHLRKTGTPPLSIETQVSLAHTIEPDEAELLYALLPPLGIPNINYYLYVGGENPKGYESHNGITWDVYSPIGLDGKEREHVEAVRYVSASSSAPGLREAKLKPKVAVGAYEPYEALSLWGYEGLKESTDLNEYLLGERGLLTLLAMSNTPFDVVDLEDATLEELLNYRQLWVYSLDFMGREVQEKLAAFVSKGGNLVVMPTLPEYDENLRPCTHLSDFLGVSVEGGKARRNPRLVQFSSVSADGIDRMLVRNVVREVRGGEPIAFMDGKPVGAMVRKGSGSAIVLGFRLQYYVSHHDLHRKFVWKLKELQGVKEDFSTTHPDMIVLPMEGDGYAYVVVSNPRGHRIGGRVRYRGIELPELLGEIEMRKRGVLFLPVNVKAGNTVVHHATASLVGVEGDVLRFRNHLSNLSEVSITASAVKVIGGTIVDEAEKGDRVTLVIKHENDTFELEVL